MNSMSGQKLKGMPYTGTLPATLTGTKAGYLHRYKIYGNTEQTGTPTPENPIVPSECGERTEKLGDGIDVGASINSSGTITRNDDRWLVYYAPVESGKSYVYRASAGSVYAFYQAKPTQGATSYDGNRYSSSVANPTFIAEIDGYVAFRIGVNESPMLNLGSTALPYEPYGYKLPLLSGSTPVDIYLGESQTTRRIKKLVLTGEENWTEYSSGIYRLRISTYGSGVTGQGISSHFISVDSTSGMPDNSFVSGENFSYIKNTSAGSLTGWETYLAQQYANGTPVTIWYVLATEETGTLNEPLRKIGDYADTIDSTQTTTQIPTSANSTTISWAGEGLAPSEFDSIQEWVDIPTYTYTNGEWVADN